jgi:hypothetical protein
MVCACAIASFKKYGEFSINNSGLTSCRGGGRHLKEIRPVAMTAPDTLFGSRNGRDRKTTVP